MKQVFGPYAHGNRWRLVYKDESGQSAVSFDSKEEAEAQLDKEDRALRDVCTLRMLMATAVEIPETPAWIYFLHDTLGLVVYVGCSSDVATRLADHRAEKDFVRATVLPRPMPRGEALQLEAALIRTLRPRLNVSLGNLCES